MIEALSLKEVPGRLAAHLLYLSDQNEGGMELKLDIAKVQLAGLLGTIPETLSRILTKMNKQKLIESSGPDIRIIDRPGLEDLAAGETRLQ
jgi:CRP-like cAMP-binding protein